MTDVWSIVHQERTALISDLMTLPTDDWSTPSLCPGWDVHDVLAHLVDDAKTTRLNFIVGLIKSRFNFDRVNAQGITAEKQSDPAQTLAAFTAVKDRTSSAPAPLATRLVEITVHGEDIRRPLGIRHNYPVDAVIEALKYQLKTGVGMGGGKDRADGLRLVATDSDFTHGDGNEVRGSALALLLAISGRPVGMGELYGNGAAKLLSISQP